MKLHRIIIVLSYMMFSFFNQLFAQTDVKEFSKAERIIKKMIRKRKVPGLAITISKNQKVVWSEGYGFADRKKKIPIYPDSTFFRIGSVSKPIAAIGLLNALQEQLIALDTSIYNYVPYFPKKQYDITIRQLGGHLSGIRNYKGNEFKNNKPLSIREGVALFENDSLLFEPGTDYFYTSYNWNLISLAIQEQSKLPFEEYIKTRVLNPFKMNSTVPDKQDDTLVNKAVFYRKIGRRRFKQVGKVNNYFKLAGGGYLSTSEDINKFGNALLNDALVSQEQLRPFITSQSTIDNKLTYYGLGFQASYDHAGRTYFGHVGNGLGGYGIFYVYPEKAVVISILMNCSNPNIDEQFNALIDEIFEALETIEPHK